jgi:hypothetical protein
MSGYEVAVRRLSAEYLVARDHPDREGLRRRLDDVVETRLCDALARVLDALALPDRGEVIAIRRLELDFDLDASLPPREQAEVWAVAIAKRLLAMLAGGGEDVVRFESPAHELAAYVQRRAFGDEGAWFLRRFDGLRVVPTSPAIRTALTADRELGMAAWQTLDRTVRSKVVDVVTERDARLWVEGWIDPTTSSPAPDTVAEVLASESLSLPRTRLTSWRATASIVVAYAASGGSVSAAVVRWVREAQRLIAQQATSTERTPSGAMEDPPSPALADDVNAADVPPSLLRVLRTAAGLEPHRPGAGDGPKRTSPTRELTRAGGAMMLLPFVDALDLDGVAEDWASCGDVAADALCRLFVVAFAAGEAWPTLFEDPPLRNMMGVGGGVGPTEAMQWLAVQCPMRIVDDATPKAPVEAVRAASRWCVERVAARLIGFGASSPAFVWQNVLDVPGRVSYAPGEILVEVARPPLHVVVRMTRLCDIELRLSWRPDVVVRLEAMKS